MSITETYPAKIELMEKAHQDEISLIKSKKNLEMKKNYEDMEE